MSNGRVSCRKCWGKALKGVRRGEGREEEPKRRTKDRVALGQEGDEGMRFGEKAGDRGKKCGRECQRGWQCED